MTTLSTTELRSNLSDTLHRVAFKGERAVVTRSGKRLVAVVPVDDLELLEAIEDAMDVDAAKEALKERGTVAWAKVKAELGL